MTVYSDDEWEDLVPHLDYIDCTCGHAKTDHPCDEACGCRDVYP